MMALKAKISGVEAQRGATLVVALVFLLILTLIGVTATQTSNLQERMVGNTLDVNRAFQSAEAALRTGEAYLEQAVIGPFDGSVNGLYQPNEGATSNFRYIWQDPTTGWITRPGTLPEVTQQPQYIVEEMPPMQDPQGSLAADEPLGDIQFYRVTARGFGQTTATTVMVQSTYRR